jgi:hypothetical protein
VVTVDDIDLSGFDVAFNVSKSTQPEPNTCDLRIFNLGRALRRELASKVKAGTIFVSLSAGYAGKLGQLYRGDLRDVYSVQEQATWVTTISSGDGETARRNARLRRAFPKGTKVEMRLPRFGGHPERDYSPRRSTDATQRVTSRFFQERRRSPLTGSRAEDHRGHRQGARRKQEHAPSMA